LLPPWGQRSGLSFLRRKRGGPLTIGAQRLVIRGRVQGVGYRDAAVQAAFECGVHGWVRNRRDGSVEALLIGDSAAVEAAVAACGNGPRLAEVSSVERSPATDDGSSGFVALPTI